MYKSLYDYNATDTSQLSIKEGQTFEFREVCNEHWWSMKCCENGKIGLVPISYLTEIKHTTNLVSPETSTLTSFLFNLKNPC